MTTRLDGKIAIVTGASRGIGKAIAIGLARQGAKVVATARLRAGAADPDALTIERTAQEIEALGGEAIACPCDVTNEDDVAHMVDATVAKWGRIDVLINNAGLKGGERLEATSSQRWRDMFDTNVFGVYLCSMAVLPHMKRQGAGSIITISSGRAQTTDAGGAAYAASKAAADRFMIKLAAELAGTGISANSLLPGPTATEESIALGAQWAKQTTEEKQIIPSCVFLATQTDQGITGQTLDEADFGTRWP